MIKVRKKQPIAHMYKKILLFGYLVFITFLSLMPGKDLPDIMVFPYADKVIHACMYAGFTFLLLLAYPVTFSGRRQFLPFLIVVAYGFFMEMLQRISILGRSFDLRDELANSLGFFPGWLFWKWTLEKHALSSLTGRFISNKKDEKDLVKHEDTVKENIEMRIK